MRLQNYIDYRIATFHVLFLHGLGHSAKQTTVSTVLIFILWLYVLSLEESVQSLMQLLSAKVQTTPNVNNVRSHSAKAKD